MSVTVNKTIHTVESLRRIAQIWDERAKNETGKTRENGWRQWELDAAARRQEYCVAKRDACLAEARRIG